MATLPEWVGLDVQAKDVELPTNTFLIDWKAKQIVGMDDGLDAMRQAVHIILNIERYRWQIYSSNFGVELEELTGEEYDYITSEIPRRIEEAFSMDSRILSVENFEFKNSGGGIMACTFDVVTVYGAISGEVTV